MLSNVSKQAQQDFSKAYKQVLKLMEWGNINEDTAQEMLTDVIYSLSESYGDVCGMYAADLFEELSMQEYGRLLRATMASGIEYSEAADLVDKAINSGSDLTVNPLLGATDKAVKQTARNTMAENIDKYGDTEVKWARIPQGSYTCAFCLMLASRDFVYTSAHLAGKKAVPVKGNNWYHDWCDCAVVPSWEQSPKVEGYEPKVYYGIYEAARKAVIDDLAKKEGVKPDYNRMLTREHTDEILHYIRKYGGDLVEDEKGHVH